jgi:beta-N-acetylhexosaminidase
MEGRPPPDDDPFEWTDAPARPRRRREPDTGERDTFNTGERDSFDRERDLFDTGERESHEAGEGTAERERPRPGDPYEPGQEAYERAYETGERPYETGERELYDTGERLRPEEEELLDTAERRARERRQRRGRRAPDTGSRSLLERHRELPAKVRRRQAIGAGVLVAAVLVGGIVLASGGGGGDGEEGTPLKKLAGQTIVAPMNEEGPDKRLLKQARKGRIGGVILIGDLQPNDVQADLTRLRKAARSGGNPPLLVMTDQEGGFVKRLPGPPDLDPNELGESADPTVAKAEGAKTAQFLKPLGINVDLAPLMDVTIPQTADTIRTRTFGDDPALVSELGVAFIQGLQEGGVSATAKHFPGLGLSTVNTDFRRVDIAATPEDQAAALQPFQAAIDARVDLVMMSSAIYPDLDAQNPAALSPAVVQQLRDQLGFEGLVITDDLEARAIADVMAPNEAAVAALNAGNDLLLFGVRSATSRQALDGILRAEKKGAIDRATVEAAYDRVTAFKATLNGG